MKKKLYALSGVFLIVLVIAGLWAAKAVSLTSAQQTIDSSPQTTSTAAELSLEQMTKEASVIVTGTCLQTKSQWVGRSLFTMATVLVEDSIKGDPAARTEVTVALPGGIGSKGKFQLAQTIAGAPQMYPTNKVFLFLSDKSPVAGSYSVKGFAQGNFSISKADDGDEVVTRNMTMAPLQKGVGVTRGNRQVLSLSEFKARVKSYLNK
ncbi:MAG TPA: hypothetical protein VE715_17290 [Blastocatellia bacterium]|nr:hypothetical protein [Blastocatellia bacterium]